MPGAWLVLPTYNEAENIEPLVDAVLPQLAGAAPEHRLLVVDDNSPDGTGQIADRLASQHDAIEVLHRPGKDGLGRPTWPGSRTRSPAAPSSCSRWTPTSRTTRATSRG